MLLEQAREVLRVLEAEGVLVGVGASSAVSAVGMPSSVPAWSIYVSFLVCVFIGVLFGYIPAQKAANMDPIEAIRHE